MFSERLLRRTGPSTCSGGPIQALRGFLQKIREITSLTDEPDEVLSLGLDLQDGQANDPGTRYFVEQLEGLLTAAKQLIV